MTTSLSIALATYQGGRFLAEQFASIAGQSSLPDELVICDDGSTDETLHIIERFQSQAPFVVRLHKHPVNLGSTAAFEQAIRFCQGDMIALADQDDVWLPHKLGRLRAALADQPQAGLAFSDGTLADEQLRPLGCTIWDVIGFSRRERQHFRQGHGFECLLRRQRITGATMAFRSTYRDLVLPMARDWVHDGWIALLIAAVAPVVMIEEPLIVYRQHPGQQIGERRRNVLDDYRKARAMNGAAFHDIADRFAAAHERLQSSSQTPPQRLEALAEKVRHARTRAGLRESGVWRLPHVVREWRKGNYARYSRGWQAIAQDLFL